MIKSYNSQQTSLDSVSDDAPRTKTAPSPRVVREQAIAFTQSGEPFVRRKIKLLTS
ncbi:MULTISPECIES: hypothetical protein [Nostoc]|uniref:Uncharacterized protein n=1 Tax=Nostoc paludosum FACHB-159 TaxID=2692908 RepID=A0ABR8K826_9NOSO|nr:MULTISPECIES: hypothetical protein [Nostoc]MBD2676768.1 hypothetical protein [Nostoc sp. FACHB-857]MBD2734956.1 hypothetical protein [Nostoc paludosum FACHB-159]